jgi:anti-sigma factor RsiW
MSDPACRPYRELLGVYVVGAIEPHERSLLDAHLNQCHRCREELAGLAVLPALLHRIPIAEAEQLVQPDPDGIDSDDPAPELLGRLIGEVKARRRTRRLRGMFAAAAAIVVAAGGSVAVATQFEHSTVSQAASFDVVSKRADGLFGTVKYAESPTWGTEIWARVSGVREWTQCKFWITTADGHTDLVGGWLVGPGGSQLWYPSRTDVSANSIIRFTLTSDGKVLLSIPA